MIEKQRLIRWIKLAVTDLRCSKRCIRLRKHLNIHISDERWYKIEVTGDRRPFEKFHSNTSEKWQRVSMRTTPIPRATSGCLFNSCDCVTCTCDTCGSWQCQEATDAKYKNVQICIDKKKNLNATHSNSKVISEEPYFWRETKRSLVSKVTRNPVQKSIALN